MPKMRTSLVLFQRMPNRNLARSQALLWYPDPNPTAEKDQGDHVLAALTKQFCAEACVNHIGRGHCE